MTVDEARRILRLSADCTPEQVRQAYTDLVKVWHPDRFQSDPRLREKADETLRLVNAAYALLQRPEAVSSGAADASPEQEPSRPAAEEAAASTVPPAPAARIRRTGLWAAIAGSIVGVALMFAFVGRQSGQEESAEPEPVAAADAASQPDSAASPAEDPRRPQSGGDLAPAAGHGAGRFATQNGTPYDAVVLMDQGVEAERTFFLRSGEQVTFLDLVPGTYHVRVILGTGWTGREFSRLVGHYEIGQPATVLAPQGTLNIRPTVVVIEEGTGLRSLPPFRIE